MSSQPPSTPEPESRSEPKFFTSHDPACDQCRIKKIGCGRELPSCSNCVKAKVKCVRSDKGKRPNQVNKLVDDVAEARKQLTGLETSINLIHRRLDEFAQSLPRREHIDATKSGQTLHHEVSQKPSSLMSGGFLDLPLSDRNISGNSLSPVLGSSSLVSLFEIADEKITMQLDKMKPKASLRETLRVRSQPDAASPPSLDGFLAVKSDVYQGLPLPTYTSGIDLSHDGASLLLPPKRLLDPIVEPYFRHITAVVPLIGRQACLQAIDRHYNPEVPFVGIEPAWVILLNYMILFCFVGQYMPLDRPSTDIDVGSVTHFEKPFVTNIRRSFAVIDRLLSPRLVNVQALLALTLISQRYFSEHITQYLLNLTCFVAKSIGLHEQRGVHDGLSADDMDERKRVFSCLFIVDKDVSMLLGTPPNFHHQDCDVECPRDATYDYRLRLDSSILFGKVYNKLYSPAVARASLPTVERSIDDLLADLDNFQCAIDNGSPSEMDSMSQRAWKFLKLEQRHFVHHARLMVLRRSSLPAKYAQRLTEARQCIETIARVRAARPTVGGFMVLRRPFQWRPFAAFFELLPLIFSYPIAAEHLQELARLKELVSMLHFVTSADDASSYCGKLFRIAGACIALADEFVQNCLDHQNGTSTTPSDSVQSGLSRKRKASATSLSSNSRAEPARCLAIPSHRADELYQIHSTTASIRLEDQPTSSTAPTANFPNTTDGHDTFNVDDSQAMYLDWPQEGFLSLFGEFFWGDGI